MERKIIYPLDEFRVKKTTANLDSDLNLVTAKEFMQGRSNKDVIKYYTNVAPMKCLKLPKNWKMTRFPEEADCMIAIIKRASENEFQNMFFKYVGETPATIYGIKVNAGESIWKHAILRHQYIDKFVPEVIIEDSVADLIPKSLPVIREWDINFWDATGLDMTEEDFENFMGRCDTNSIENAILVGKCLQEYNPRTSAPYMTVILNKLAGNFMTEALCGELQFLKPLLCTLLQYELYPNDLIVDWIEAQKKFLFGGMTFDNVNYELIKQIH